MALPTDPSAPATERAQPLPAVLFADLAGSTRLYESLGDAVAKRRVDECLAVMGSVTARRGGRVIKTIGDELMCVFPDADRAALAAIDMQLAVAALPAAGAVRRAIRIGFHAGPLLEEGGDVFGDTVNTAARMTSLAKASQIITTAACIGLLSPLLRAGTRHIASLPVRGKGDEVAVYEVLWQSGDDLTMAASASTTATAFRRLHLEHGARSLVLESGWGFLLVGRDPSCHLVLSDRKASRVHARLEWRRDKFFLIDQSTNGTYLTFAGEAEVVLRREEVMLRGRGSISFGHSSAEPAGEKVDFEVQ